MVLGSRTARTQPAVPPVLRPPRRSATWRPSACRGRRTAGSRRTRPPRRPRRGTAIASPAARTGRPGGGAARRGDCRPAGRAVDERQEGHERQQAPHHPSRPGAVRDRRFAGGDPCFGRGHDGILPPVLEGMRGRGARARWGVVADRSGAVRSGLGRTAWAVPRHPAPLPLGVGRGSVGEPTRPR